ncbi:MAG TPA: acyl-CoA dehydrogenase family protein [Leptospiraceae bacterium]|jgi:acyl-CoA dehydrogenase|nr:acyl-CoA dehydrogenase family protein [Leptospirales bacterium]HMU84331.1 acyl-CoA dehydrogenase family protein [Leptospiraceae bacterium]HMW58372.1 acyl-CoA dehydrogenase family protein [Leptospiraceae bacterium]HMX55605.1 acyl-CoA dehydrogenase family protein [Leptospiraceae bacterium]HMZ35355.1 acyl-CoA dehydrogenase family protein [Leptospiraceae bacterium]
MKQLPRILPFTKEHDDFRAMAADFFDQEVAPHHEQWEKDGIVPREIWAKAGSLGLICPNFPEEYGGAGADFLYNLIVIEESARVGASGFFISLHADVIAPYVLHHASDEQKQRWLPGIIDGTKILAIAMTEPGAGSDLAGITSTAIDKGDHYLVNGSKTFISNGYLSDLIITVAKTDPEKEINGISLLMVERGMEGFERGKRLKKIGLNAQDTSELFYHDVKVPKANLLGKKGYGFRYLMSELATERLVLAASSMRGCEVALEETLKYVKTRKAFGKSLGSFQNTQFKLADAATEVAAARCFLDQVILAFMRGDKVVVEASQAKLLCSELLKKTVDTCLQFFGGYGYMMEYPIARAFVDARVQSIYAGTSEIMRGIIASKGLGL